MNNTHNVLQRFLLLKILYPLTIILYTMSPTNNRHSSAFLLMKLYMNIKLDQLDMLYYIMD